MILSVALGKELRLLTRDLHGLAVLFLMPILFMLIMSAALSRVDAPPAPAHLVLVGERALNDDFIERLQKSGIAIELAAPDSRAAQEAALAAGDINLLIINPNHADTPPAAELPWQLWFTPDTDPARQAALQGILQRAHSESRIHRHLAHAHIRLPHPAFSAQANAQLAQIHADLAATLRREPWHLHYLDRQGSRIARPDAAQHSVPAWLIFGMFFIMIPLSNVMTLERHTNTLTRLRMAQASAAQLLIAKLLPYYLINQLQFAGMIALGYTVLPALGLPAFTLPGSIFPYILLASAISLAALGYGLLVSVLAKSSEHAVVLGGGGIIIMAALGGIMVPTHVMPAFMQTVAQCSPMGWALAAFQNLMLNHATLSQITRPLALLTAFALLTLSLAARRYHHQLHSQARF